MLVFHQSQNSFGQLLVIPQHIFDGEFDLSDFEKVLSPVVLAAPPNGTIRSPGQSK
jgi:hypothetical protein